MSNNFVLQPPRSLLANIGALFSGTVAARLLSMISLALITRSVGPQQFGLYAATLALAKLTSVVFSLGLDGWLLRHGNLEEGENQLSQRFGASLLIQTGGGLVWLGLLGVGGLLLDRSIYPLDLLLLAGLTVWLEELAYTCWTTFKIRLDNRITLVLMVAFQSLILTATVGLIFAGVTAILPFALARAGATAIATAATLFFTFRRIGIQVRWPLVKRSLAETLPYGLSMALTLIYGRADVTIIAWHLDERAVGLYVPAVSLILAMALAPAAIYGVVLPAASRLFASNAPALAGFARRVLLGNLLLGLISALGLVLIARPLVWLIYGPDYAASGALLIILSGVLGLRTVSFGLAAFVVAVGLQNQRVVVQAVAALFNVAANLLVVRDYGLPGVAVVYCLSEALLMLGYGLLFLRWLRNAPRTEVIPHR